MDTIISIFQSGLSYVGPMVVLLGLLVFIHELGHFLVAKYYKVRVETFSLGFGPKLLKIKRGDTVYAISAIPLGGYVKMFGDEVGGTVDADQRQHAFTHKPVFQRIAVVLAGPLMNFFFAILVFMVMAMVGEQSIAPKLGDIDAKSAAYAAGFRSGDTILSVDGQNLATWDRVQKAIEASGDKLIKFEVRKEGATNKETLMTTPQLVQNKNVLSWDDRVGEIEGLTYSSRASVIGVNDLNSPAGLAGLQAGDQITAVDGIKVEKWREMASEMAQHSSDPKIALTVVRGGLSDEKASKDSADAKTPTESTLDISLSVPNSAHALAGNDFISALGIEDSDLYLAPMPEEKSLMNNVGLKKSAPTSPAAAAGLREGDKILAINDSPVASFDDIAKNVRNFSGDGALEVKYRRQGKDFTTKVVPNLKNRMSTQGREEKRYEIGIRPMIVEAQPELITIAVTGPLEALARGVTLTLKWTSLTVLSFVRLFQNEVSAKNIGGFLSIGQMAKKSWQMGMGQFLHIMGIISINLFILNLLPVPVLDGGHLLFYSIEAVKGSPLSMKKLELAQQLGLVLLLSLMAFALFNDVTRLFGG